MTAVELYQKFFPHARPNIFQMEYIEAHVSDLSAWEKALEFWAGNDYRAQSVFKMVEYAKEIHAPKFDVGRNTEPAPVHSCSKCFDTGYIVHFADGAPPTRSDCDCEQEAAA